MVPLASLEVSLGQLLGVSVFGEEKQQSIIILTLSLIAPGECQLDGAGPMPLGFKESAAAQAPQDA